MMDSISPRVLIASAGLVLALALSAAPIASAEFLPITAVEARHAAGVVSERWLGAPTSRVRCARKSRRKFMCTLVVEGPTDGPLSRASCEGLCTIHTVLCGLVVEKIGRRMLYVKLGRRWNIQTQVYYARTGSVGVARGVG